MAASGRKFGLDGSTVRAKAEVDMVLDEAADVRNVIFNRKIDTVSPRTSEPSKEFIKYRLDNISMGFYFITSFETQRCPGY